MIFSILRTCPGDNCASRIGSYAPVLLHERAYSESLPDKMNGFMNIRVADIEACYESWKSRGAEFITEPISKYGEIRCYIRDPDGYIIEVGQSTELKYG